VSRAGVVTATAPGRLTRRCRANSVVDGPYSWQTVSASTSDQPGFIQAPSAQLRIWTGSPHIATPSAYMGVAQVTYTGVAAEWHPHLQPHGQPLEALDAFTMTGVAFAYLVYRSLRGFWSPAKAVNRPAGDTTKSTPIAFERQCGSADAQVALEQLPALNVRTASILAVGPSALATSRRSTARVRTPDGLDDLILGQLHLIGR
jgi:hypothetical protein